MSSILPLAKRLRELSAEELAGLLKTLSQASLTCSDLFDLAKLMLGKRELEDRIRKLPAPEIENLKAGKSSAVLRASFLADTKVFPEAQENLQTLKPLLPIRLSSHASSLSAYETLLAVTEIIFAMEQHWFEKTRTGLKAADAKLIAEKFKWQPAEIQLRFRLAIRAGLIGDHDGRWIASSKAEDWLTLTRQQAWVQLAQSVWDLPKLKLIDASMVDQLLIAYPLIDMQKIALLEFGSALGLLDTDLPRQPLLAGSFAAVSKSIASELPKPQDKLLVQGDLSIVCPGPIDASLQRKLDSFADSEDLGLACRFRLTNLSVSHHLEAGGTVEEIREVLQQASGNSLPQPVQYLLDETSKKFANLQVGPGSPVEIFSTDEILLTQILNEKTLVHLNLRKGAGILTSPHSQELCYFSLRDAGYAAVMVSDSKVISPRFKVEAKEIEKSSELMTRAKSLLSGEKASADQGDISRQLQFALKNKLPVSVKVELDGTEQTLQLTPLGIAGNRLRGRDEAKQAERTLPLARIRSVVLG